MADKDATPDFAEDLKKELPVDDFKILVAEANEAEKTKTYKMAKFKVDCCITGACMLFYLLSFIDKANLGNAMPAGLQRDLKITSWQYSVALTIFYPPYILTELPANLIVKRVGAHRLLPTLVVLFGLVCCVQGTITSYPGLLACRFFLGLVEGGLIPSLVIWCSTWYKRDEFQFRTGLIFSFISLAGAFAGLLAAAILTLDGKHGVAGWKWIFYIEGGVTIGVGVLGFVWMRPTPETAWFLNQQEKDAYITVLKPARLRAGNTGTFSWGEVVSCFKSPFAMVMATMNIGSGIVIFGFSYFLPTVVATFGWGKIGTQLHTVPIYAVVFVVALGFSYLGDRYHFRGPQYMIYGALAVVGYAIAIAAKEEQRNLRFAALFLQIFGGPATSAASAAWQVDNVAPYYKRATSIAISFSTTQIGGIVSTWIYPKEDAPLYRTGATVSLIGCIWKTTGACILTYWTWNQNRIKRAKLAALADDYVFPDAPMDDRDLRYKYII